MNVVVFTSDHHNWCLKPFSILFNKYWGDNQKVDIAGYSEPEFDLPSNFSFHSIAKPQYNKSKWADGVLRFFDKFEMRHAVVMLEDYWLTRKVDQEDIQSLENFSESMGNNVLRIDLTADRLYAGECKDYGYWEKFDIVQARYAQYEMSLQCGLWNIKTFIDVLTRLKPQYRSAWDVEINGTTIVHEAGFDVYGTRQWPVRYCNGLNNATGKKVITSGMTESDIELIMPYVPEENR